MKRVGNMILNYGFFVLTDVRDKSNHAKSKPSSSVRNIQVSVVLGCNPHLSSPQKRCSLSTGQVMGINEFISKRPSA